jgi:uncharacterized protein YhdP
VRRPLGWLLAGVAAIGVLAAAATIALPYLVATPRVQSLIASQASSTLGRPVTFSSVSATVFPRPAVVLNGLKVADDARFGATPFVTLERGELRLRLGPLFAGRLEFGDLVLRKPVIAVAQDAQGRWNFATLGTAPEPRSPAARAPRTGGGAVPAPPIASDVKLEDGVVTVTVRPPGRSPQTYRIDDVDASIRGAPSGATVEGTARLQPGGLSVKLSDGRLIQNGKPLNDAGLAGTVTIDGKQLKDLAAVALGPSATVAAAVKGTLALGGTLANPRATGDVTLSDVAVTQTNARCPDPKQRTLKLDTVKLAVAWQQGRFSAAPVQTGIARGAISSHVITTLDRGIHVQARDLVIRAVPLKAVLVDFLCQGYAVTGPLDLTGALSFDPRDIWNTLAGSGQLRIGAGKVVGAQALAVLGGVAQLGGAVSSLMAADMPASRFSSPLEFDSITGTYQIARGVVTTRDLVYASRAMRVGVVGDYALGSGRMNLDLVIDHGRGEIQAKVTGSAGSPSIRVVPASVLRSVDPDRARTGLQELLRRLR